MTPRRLVRINQSFGETCGFFLFYMSNTTEELMYLQLLQHRGDWPFKIRTSSNAKYTLRYERRTEYILFGNTLLYTGDIWIDITIQNLLFMSLRHATNYQAVTLQSVQE
jgi:hypothetical protein